MKKTIIYDWKKKINKNELENVIRILDHDGIVIFPTDTVYGIGGNCFSDLAIERLFSLKRRSYQKPINVLTDSFEKVKMVSDSISLKEKRIIDDYMPGALTIILHKKDNISNLLTANLDTIGVRIPNHPIALKILESINYPLATSSANISGYDAGICIEDIIDEFKGKVDVIIDGGISPIKKASTIVQVCENKIKVLRKGSCDIIDI